MWFVYILKCADGNFYVGITTDLKRRVREHNTFALGAKYTRGRRPVKLVYSGKLKNRSLAAKKEFQIKQMTKLEKKKLVRHEKIFKFPLKSSPPAVGVKGANMDISTYPQPRTDEWEL